MSKEQAAVLERLMRASNLGGVLDAHPPADRLLGYLLTLLERVGAEYRARFDGAFDLDVLNAEWPRNPHKVGAFLQATRESRSPEMLVMVWRILQGSVIEDVKMTYQNRKFFELVVQLTDPGSNAKEEYKSVDIFDARLLRHFGMASAGDQPSFNGFFSLHLAS